MRVEVGVLSGDETEGCKKVLSGDENIKFFYVHGLNSSAFFSAFFIFMIDVNWAVIFYEIWKFN